MGDDELTRIKGPFDFWNFPFLNAFVEVVRIRNGEVLDDADDSPEKPEITIEATKEDLEMFSEGARDGE